MPHRKDFDKILIIGSGPIVVGQACEFDYSGTQAVKALKELGYKIILVNSNPATIMTDPGLADRTYIEPLDVEHVRRVIEKEKPQAMLATLGGQTALNLACDLDAAGVLANYNVELIGAGIKAIKKAEDRGEFREAMQAIGIPVPKSAFVTQVSEGLAAAEEIGFPLVIRASFTLGGKGSSIVYSKDDLVAELGRALELSPVKSVLMEQYLRHWKEYELELMRDRLGNQSVVAAIENFDPMGVHTGDSITVCPAMTLSDREYQKMRDMAFRAYEALGIACGGSNVQFGVNPKNGDIVIIEINPRVSRSSALASKATGFPIAKIAAQLAVGMTLDEIANDITQATPASFEPSVDYVVVKIPRFDFGKFPGADAELTSQMKSVGEAMSIGRSFLEALQKGLRSLELGLQGLQSVAASSEELLDLIRKPNAKRILAVYRALLEGMSVEEIHSLSGIDPWFLWELEKAARIESALRRNPMVLKNVYDQARRMGFDKTQLASICKKPLAWVEAVSKTSISELKFFDVDTCAGEFEAKTPYFYSASESPSFAQVPAPDKGKKKVLVIGSGPNRIGQGIEFDYACVHAVGAIRELGMEAVMVNSNPETVSTDYDTADRLYFEPLTLEHLLAVVEREKQGLLGILTGFGGQTPINLVHALQKALGSKMILGTSVDKIDIAEDRKRFAGFLKSKGIRHPAWCTAKSSAEAKRLASSKDLKLPILVRPSYVLGGRGMRIFYERESLVEYLAALPWQRKDSKPLELYLDEFLDGAVEIDVDVVGDGKNFQVAGVMEHIEEAGIHSGDSSCVWPPMGLSEREIKQIEAIALKIAKGLGVKGLLNIQFALYEGKIYVIEANPRASRTVPFISKATGIPWPRIAAKACLGEKIPQLLAPYRSKLARKPQIVAVKAPVFSWSRFPGADVLLGPEMRSTGEVMAFGAHFGEAFLKIQAALLQQLPRPQSGVLLSIKEEDKAKFLPLAKGLHAAGFTLFATRNTARYLRDHGAIDAREVFKLGEGRPNVVDTIANGEVSLVVNTPSGATRSRADGYYIRNAALTHNVALISTPRPLQVLLDVLTQKKLESSKVYCLQDLN